MSPVTNCLCVVPAYDYLSKSKFIAGSIDVDWLVKENDLDRLESVQHHLSGAPLSTLLQNSVLDGSVVKYFELAQLSIQFLLFCKQFLDQGVTTLRNNFCELRRKNEKLERLCKRRNEELLAVHSNQRQQGRPAAGDTDPLAAHESILMSRTLVCPKCCKDAINSSGMEIERMATTTVGPPFNRNHPANSTKAPTTGEQGDSRNTTAVAQEENRSQRIESQDINLINAIKLELEVKHLRARLAEVELGLGEEREKGPSSRRLTSWTRPEPHEQVVCEWGETASAEKLHQQQPLRSHDVGVQIDGISIVHQTEKASVIVGSSAHVEPTEDVVVQGNSKTSIEGVTDEGRLMALVQEQLSKALGQWTAANTTMTVNREDVIRPELERDQMPSSPAPSSAKLGLSRKPTEIISIDAEMSPVHHRQQSVFYEEVKRVLQEEVRSIEKHWQAKYSHLESVLNEKAREKAAVVQLESGDEHTDSKVTDVVLPDESSKPSGMCREQKQQQPQPQPQGESKPCLGISVDKEIDKNELLMPQVGGINTKNWQAGGRHHHHQQVTTLAKRVQLGSSHKTHDSLLTSKPPSHPQSTQPGPSVSTSYAASDNGDEGQEAEDEEDSQECDWNNLLSTASANAAAAKSEEDDPIDSDSAEEANRPEVNEGVRRKVICELSDRLLLDMGIQAKRKGITRDALNTATCRLADRRELQKSKWKKFFVIRNRVVSKVNGLVAARLNRDQKIIQEVLRQEVKQPMEIRPSRDLRSSGSVGGVHQHESFPEREHHGRAALLRNSGSASRGGSANEMSDGSSNLVTVFNRIPEDDCSTEDSDGDGDEDADHIAGFSPPSRNRQEVVAAPKPLPRKVLFNLSENNRKLGSLESSESSAEKEVR